ncbi:hypothetical protein GGR54DRAFT_584010 [Hypoxylon sp. NC1633]|nr:hypothetical protein GGR54DRAFT_584010 [Hypoxylon sp. NC1633]
MRTATAFIRALVLAPLATLTSISLAEQLLWPPNTNNADALLSPQTISGNVDCAAASTTTTFQLRWVSYGNYTAQAPGPGDDTLTPAQLMSMTFAATNEANGVDTECAFPLGRLAANATWVDDASWQACADRKDTDGKHRFTIATGALFARAERRIAVNQTWFCHDDDGRLVAYTGVASGTLDMTCFDGGELGGYHVENCTSPDVVLPVTLL